MCVDGWEKTQLGGPRLKFPLVNKGNVGPINLSQMILHHKGVMGIAGITPCVLTDT